jgi:Rieske Fe-S protein
MNRRTVLKVLGSTAAVFAADVAWGAAAAVDTNEEVTTFDAGPLDAFEQEKVYDQFRDQGVLLIRRGDEVFALSSICTHRGCKVRAQDDNSLLCKCHKSHFDADGKVLNGPATKDLLRLKVKLSADSRVLVRVSKPQLTG